MHLWVNLVSVSSLNSVNFLSNNLSSDIFLRALCATKRAKYLPDIVSTVELHLYPRIVNDPVLGFRDSVGFYDIGI